MSFVLVERGKWGNADGPLSEGQVSLQKTGAATFLAEDLKLVGITDKVVILADPSNNRVALRVPSADERSESVYAIREIKGKDGKATGRVQTNVLQGIRRLGLEPKLLRGRYDCTITDNLIWWSFGELSRTDKRIAEGGAGKPSKANKQPPESDELDGDGD